jgi:hypothetical protein
MTARTWRGWAPPATADDYQRHYSSEVSGHLRAAGGFRGARLLRQDGQEVMFTSITYFTSPDAVRGEDAAWPIWRCGARARVGIPNQGIAWYMQILRPR